MSQDETHHTETLLRAEVVDLHRFFVRWYAGTAPPDEAASVVARFREDFGYIFPGGIRSSREDLAAMLAASHGANPDFRIQVTAFSFQALLVTGDVALWGVTYEEYQSGARNSAADNGRLSSAVFEVRDGAACWVHLHECWLPAGALRMKPQQDKRATCPNSTPTSTG
ncbi:MAG: hypothetical protein ACI8RZ_003707 [Myxococcota bacterium]|jgi:hypothetical protein